MLQANCLHRRVVVNAITHCAVNELYKANCTLKEIWDIYFNLCIRFWNSNNIIISWFVRPTGSILHLNKSNAMLPFNYYYYYLVPIMSGNWTHFRNVEEAVELWQIKSLDRYEVGRWWSTTENKKIEVDCSNFLFQCRCTRQLQLHSIGMEDGPGTLSMATQWPMVGGARSVSHWLMHKSKGPSRYM